MMLLTEKYKYDFYPFNSDDCILVEGNKAIVKQPNTDKYALMGIVAIPLEETPTSWQYNINDIGKEIILLKTFHALYIYNPGENEKNNNTHLVIGFCSDCNNSLYPNGIKDEVFVLKLTKQFESQIKKFINYYSAWDINDFKTKFNLINNIRNEAKIEIDGNKEYISFFKYFGNILENKTSNMTYIRENGNIEVGYHAQKYIDRQRHENEQNRLFQAMGEVRGL